MSFEYLKCHECKKTFKGMKGLSSHIRQEHNLTSKKYYDKFLKSENEEICPVCNESTRFISLSKGYALYCSAKCASNTNSETSKKRKNTLKEKYGVEHPAQSDEIKNKMKLTMLKKYGVEYSFLSEDLTKKARKTSLERYGDEFPQKTKEVKEKTKQTNLKNLGVEYPAQNKKVYKKIEETNLKKYEATSPSKNHEIKNKIRQSIDEKVKSLNEGDYRTVDSLCQEFGYGWYHRKGNNTLINKSFIPEIVKYNERCKSVSIFEKEVYDFIRTIYDGEIIQNDRKILNPLEIDIFIPKYNLAIECNGVFYHSSLNGKDKNYHLSKTEKAKEKKIQLIHILDWEWENKKDIVKSIIASKIGLTPRKIYARNCIVKSITNKESKPFMDENHISGGINSSLSIGLFYGEELVQVATFGKSRFKQDEYELYRMATVLNTQVVGGFSKLIKFFKHLHPETSVISFVDLSKFNGESYKKIGFEILNQTPPSYSYFNRNLRLNRISAQKHKLKKILGEDNFNPNKTEFENMTDNGWHQVFDCGNLKLKYN